MKNLVAVIFLLLVACSTNKPAAQTATYPPTVRPSATTEIAATETIATAKNEPTEYPTSYAEHKVEEYLRTNNGCDLPCFWSIVPGETSLDDAINFFQPFGISGYHGKNNQDTQRQYAVSLYVLSKLVQNGATLFEDDGIIEGFDVFGGGSPHDVASFWDIWKSYRPQNIIAEYGYPDRIWFDTYRNPEIADPDRPLGYSVWFYYDDKDFLIVYSGITSKAPDYKVCLGKKTVDEDFGNLSADINLLIHTDTPLEKFANEQRIYYTLSFYSDKDRGIPVDVFMNMIDQEGCFPTPSRFQP